MANSCTTVTDYIQTEISTPMEEWEEQKHEKCKKAKWYDPRKWLCWFVLIMVKTTRWLIEYVLTPVFSVVCRLVRGLINIFIDALQFAGLLLKALFTWNKCTLQEAFAEFGNVLLGSLLLLGDSLIRPIVDRVQTARLRDYVKAKIAERFAGQPDVIAALNASLCVDRGVFGYRLTCSVYRMYVDSRTTTSVYGDVRNLFGLHNADKIDLYALAGFDDGCALTSGEGWYRPRHQTAVYPYASGGGLGEPTPPELKRQQLDEYISSGGQAGPHFRIYAITSGNLDVRIDAAKEKARQLGLILDFKQLDKEVKDPEFIKYPRSVINLVRDDGQLQSFIAAGKDHCTQWNTSDVPTDPSYDDIRPWNKGQADYLICELGRQPKEDWTCCVYGEASHTVVGNLDKALANLCSPVAVCVFGFTDKTTRGLASNLVGADCAVPDARSKWDPISLITALYGAIAGSEAADEPATTTRLSSAMASGVSFIDDIPDEVRKYVLIHELGHYFGLCHVSGLDRIMVSGKEGQGHTVNTPALLNVLAHGGPRFTLDEAKRVWDFIFTNFPLDCFIASEPVEPSEPSEPIFL